MDPCILTRPPLGGDGAVTCFSGVLYLGSPVAKVVVGDCYVAGYYEGCAKVYVESVNDAYTCSATSPSPEG